MCIQCTASAKFLSTPSARRATPSNSGRIPDSLISIHALREEGDIVAVHHAQRDPISIHALREEGDAKPLWEITGNGQFLSTPSARRATWTFTTLSLQIWEFLSTPSARRATWTFTTLSLQIWEFLSTPSARRATAGESVRRTYLWISIHALREEGDPAFPQDAVRREISIHALREEGDLMCLCSVFVPCDFYPRPPRGGRPYFLYTLHKK